MMSCLGLDPLVLKSSAQAPGLLWSTNIGAQLFAVDDQTNLYANAGGKVIVLDSAGAPVRTNAICPLNGVAQRDGSGNFYFAGSFDGTQNFGGITLIGGWTNPPGRPTWNSGFPTCYLAKYGGNGNLLWVVSFGEQAVKNMLSDLVLDQAGGCYAAYWTATGDAIVSHFNSSGANSQNTTISSGLAFYYLGVSLGGVTSSNCCFLANRTEPTPTIIVGGRVDNNGNMTALGQFPLRWTVPESTNSKPVTDGLGEVFEVGLCFSPLPDPSCTNQLLRKCGSGGSELWRENVSPDAQWTLTTDPQSNVYLAGNNGMLAMFGSDGTLIWSNNFTQPTIGMVVDRSTNRFVSFVNGTVGRLESDLAPPPSSHLMLSADRQGLSSSGFRFTLIGDPQLTWQILGSSNVTSWHALGSVTNSSGDVQFTDPTATGVPMRFYKTRRLP